MATGSNIKTYFNGQWHDEDIAVMKAADHGAWLGSGVFDGARYFNGVAPDLEAHCARINASARALMLTPIYSVSEMKALIWEGLSRYAISAAVYIRPMYWGIDGDLTAIVPSAETTGFAISLEEIPFARLADLSLCSVDSTRTVHIPKLPKQIGSVSLSGWVR